MLENNINKNKCKLFRYLVSNSFTLKKDTDMPKIFLSSHSLGFSVSTGLQNEKYKRKFSSEHF